MDGFAERLRTGLVAVAVVSSSLVAVPGHTARWYEDYLIAVQKIEAGGCSEEAINYLGAAIVDKPKPRRNARTIAAQRIDYLPYYQLARAHLACGNLKNARENLEKSRRWGVADGRELDRLEELIRRAEAARAPTPTPIPIEAARRRSAAAEASIRAAEKALAACDEALAEAGRQGLAEPQWTRSRGSAAARLATAQETLQKGNASHDLLALADADRMAKEAALMATELEQTVRGAMEAAATPTPTPTRPARPTPTPATRIPAPQPTPTPFPLPQRLRRGAELYFLRDYEATVRVLDTVDREPAAVQAAELLLRGAARLAMARLNPDSAEELQRAAERDLARARRLAPRLRPDPDLFPPWVLRSWAAAD